LIKHKKADFIELYIVPDKSSLNSLAALKEVPVSIHSPHYNHDFNIFKINKEKIDIFQNKVIKAADYLNSKFIVLHAGVGEDKKIFKENINKINDERIIIENKPKVGMDNVRCFGYSLEQLKFIKEDCGLKICLDFAHAAESAYSQGIDYKFFWEMLIDKLEPNYFHLSDDFPNNENDEHLNMGDGKLDLKWIKKTLNGLAQKQDIHLVFETPKKGNDLKNDLDNIEYFKKL